MVDRERLDRIELVHGGVAAAQPLTWSAEYAATFTAGGTVIEPVFGDLTTLNPYFTSSATESAVLDLIGGPGFVYRDWLGNRSFRTDDGGYNLFWASGVKELEVDRDFIVTIREGWTWSDGTPITLDDVVAARVIHGDPEAQSNIISCAFVGNDPVTYEVLDERRIRITLPVAQVNGLASQDCGTLPAHVFMPVYEAGGGAAAAGLWGTATPLEEIVSGGPYLLTENRPGERMVFERNPNYTFEVAADGTPITGPERWIVTISQDQNAILAQVLTNETSFWWPTTLDQVRSIQQGITAGTIEGSFYPNIGPGTLVDFMTFNFNSTDPCKAAMFSNSQFRRAMSLLMDRDAMVQGALGGLGYAANDMQSAATAPFEASFLGPLVHDPEAALNLLAGLGFTATGSDGVLLNPATGCRVEFDVQFNSGNNRRAQLALIFSQTAAQYGVKANPREVSVEIWQNSIIGSGLPRITDFDANIWGLSGGDIDNPSGTNVLRINVNLNAWNKDAANVQPWELLIDQLVVAADGELDLDARVALWRQKATVMREHLPLIPLVAPGFHFYENLGNVWPA
ncbi:MAG: ABC transporter substrate-binding protein, partial [bacterium]|nr:ABC transporter substrate-binding protein [bacterium]